MFDLKHIAKTLILLGVLALPGAAAAAQGDLTYAGCVGDDATQDCVALPGSPIKGLTDVAVSPDGRSVYAVSPDHDTVAHFFRGPDGTLAYDGCVGNTVQGCAPVPDASLGGPNRVTVSPDGKSVYVTTRLGNGVVELKRALPDGQITFAACAADPNPADACGDLKQATLLEPQAVTVSPDGKSVYVGGAGSSTVVHFLRSSSGGLTFDSCVSTGALTNTCAKTSSPMERPIDLTVSRDGRNVYVLTEGEPATPNRAAVYVFGRVEEGQITLIGCHSSNALGNCFDVPGDPFTAAGSLQLSSLDRSLYVLGAGGTLSRMTREVVSGGLNYSSAFANPFTATQGLSMSPDGRSLYLLGTASVAHLTVGTTGDPAFSSCLASDPGAGCVDLPGTPLARPETSAVSPDGRTVYVADRAGSRIHRFDRDLTVATPTPTPTASPTATPTVSATATPIATPVSTPEATPEPTVDPDPVVVTCAGRPATVVGTAGADRLRGTPAADVVAALGGGDRVSGLRGDDVVCGGAGRDRMAAGAGRDRCVGGAGRDRAKGCEVRRTI